ncbi:MAG: hypothetical protein JXB03_07615 [Spirochaetales bacterium]|nr:hypothetical protein [Spirochaetales bacterium]
MKTLTRIMSFILTLLAFTACQTRSGSPFEKPSLEAFSQNDKYLIGVIQPENLSGRGEINDRLGSYNAQFIPFLVENGRFRVVEKDRIDRIMEEHQFNLSGLVDPESIREIGGILGVDALCFIELNRVQLTHDKLNGLIAWVNSQTVETDITARIVDIQTGELLASGHGTSVLGRKQWIAFGVFKAGTIIEDTALMDEGIFDGLKALAYDLSEHAPKK